MTEIISKQRKININELPAEIPDFSSSFEPKDSIIKKWIIDWILSAVSKKSIKENDILPNKADISKHLGVSIGTVQNAIRYVEDEGLLKSKQKIGTMISDNTNVTNSIKSTSKRDKAVIAIKKTIIQNGMSINKSLPSTRKMSEIIGISQNTIRLAYEYLKTEGIIDSQLSRGNEPNWHLKAIPVLTRDEILHSNNMDSMTIVDKITLSLKQHLSKNYSIGDKIPTHDEISKKLGVSLKTAHDSIQKLIDDGIVISRRGKYGCILARNPLDNNIRKEDMIFSDSSDAVLYSYQKIEDELIKLIDKEFNSGDKLPSMSELAKKYDVSTNTIRKALKNIAEDGYITFNRGRWGGTIVLEKPNLSENVSYQWLSINPNYL